MSVIDANAPERLTVGAGGKIVGGRSLVAVSKVPESQGLKLQWGSKLLRLGSVHHVTSTAKRVRVADPWTDSGLSCLRV